MSALLHVSLGTAKAANEKIAQAPFGTGEVVERIHRPQDGIGRHLPVERRYEPAKPVFTDGVIELMIVHVPKILPLSRRV